MLDGNSSSLAHAAQNASLLLLSLAFLPLDITILAASYLVKWLFGLYSTFVLKHPRTNDANQHTRRRTILVTGVGMTKGLCLARLFHKAKIEAGLGIRVIGADFEPSGIPAPGRASIALDKFYRLEKPTAEIGGSNRYVQGLLDIILREKVDLWVSCSGVASAVEDGEAKEIIEKRTNCRAVQFDVSTTQTLHEKDTFIEQANGFGLNVPDTHTIKSVDAVTKALNSAPQGRKYILKPIGMDDSARGDMTLFPKQTPQETSQHISRLKISEKSPWILQQFVKGTEYCTHSLVVRGRVKAFVACPSAELLMHYITLPPAAALSRAMLNFTEIYAGKCGEGFTGHLSFDFLVEDDSPQDPKDIILYPIECNPRAHTAVVLFNDTPEMVKGYLSVLEPSSREAETITVPIRPAKYYWIGHDLVAECLLPLISFVSSGSGGTDLSKAIRGVFSHLATWKDGTYEWWDPMPWFYLYHVYWPLQFLRSLLTGSKWSRVNVSTLKSFGC